MLFNSDNVFLHFLRLIKRKLIVFCVAFFTMFIACCITVFVLSEDYYISKASVIIEVQDAGSEYEGLIIGKKLVDTYQELAVADHVLNQVRDNLSLNITNQQLSDMITVESPVDTILINFFVRSNSAILSQDIAENLINELIEFSIVYLNMEDIAILDHASLAESASGPNRLLYMVAGILISLILALSVMFVSNLVDNKIISKDDVEEIIDIPVIGNILNYKYTRNKTLIDGEHKIITDLLPYSSISEEYYRIKTSIDIASIDNDLQVIDITSILPRDGKTLVSLNLASVFAKSKKKTLLIDSNPHNLSINNALNITSNLWLTDHLLNQDNLNKYITKNSDYLDVLTFGIEKTLCEEVLLSQRFKDLITDLRTKYDKIIFDTPAVKICNDSKLIALLSDATILVVRSNVTEINDLSNTVSEFKHLNINLMGIILKNLNRNSVLGATYEGYGFE